MIRQIASRPMNINHRYLAARRPEMGRHAFGNKQGHRPHEDQPGNGHPQGGRVAPAGNDQRPPREIDHAQQQQVNRDRPQGQALMKRFHRAQFRHGDRGSGRKGAGNGERKRGLEREAESRMSADVVGR